MSIIKIRKAALILFVCAALAILILSLMPNPPQPDIDINFLDKIEHFIAYLVLSGLGVTAFYSIKRKRFIPWIISGGCILCGGLIELLQPLTGRSPELADLLVDGLGSFCGMWIALFFINRFLIKQESGAAGKRHNDKL